MSEFPKIDIATQFHRNNAIPLDSTEKFDSLLSAIDYVENNGTAYAGQIITVVESNSISAFQITSEKKLDLILTETNISSKFDEISTDFEKIENLIADLSSETSADIYTINNKIKELSGIVNKNIDFIQAISVDLSDDISNIVEFNNKILTLNTHLDELSNLYKEDIDKLSSNLKITNESISELSIELKDDIEDISKKIDYIYSDLSDDISNIIDLNAKISKLNSNIDNLSSEHNTEISELKRSINNLSTITTKNINTNIESILKLSEYVFVTKNELSSEINGNTLLIDDLSTALDDLSDVFSKQNSDLEEKITDLFGKHKKDIDELSFEIKETSNDLSGRIESLYDFMQVISDDLSDDISNIVEFNNKIYNLNNSLDELSDLHKEDIEELSTKIKETNNIISELSGKHGLEIETLENYVFELSTEATNIESQVTELSTDLSSKIAWRSKPTIIIGKNIDSALSSDNRNSIMIGTETAAPASEAIAIGTDAKSTGFGTIAIGKSANNDINNKPTNAIAIGHNSKAKNNSAIAIGDNAQTGTSNSSNAIAIGTSTISRGSGSIVIGENAEIKSTSNNSVAIGVSAMVSGNNISDAIQLGTGTNTKDGTLQFRNYPLVDNNGKIFEERIPDQISVNINELSISVKELSTTTFEAISKNTELINNFSEEIELSINELNTEIDNISSHHKNDFENLLFKTEDLGNEIDSISSEFSNEISDINSSIINIFDELISNTNNINELSDSVSSLNIYIDELSDKFETFENELSDKVPNYETDPVFTKWKDSSSICLGKAAKIDDEEESVSIAIGLSAASNNNSIAIGRKSNAEGLNRVAIGSNSDANGFNSVAIGTSSVASKYSTAIGNSAKVKNSNLNYPDTNSIAIGYNAVVSNAVSAVQIGPGTNISTGTLQFKDYQLVDANGQIPFERLKNFSTKSAIDYTAFEVWITDKAIPSGQFEDFTVKETIPAGDIHTTILWSYKDLGRNPSLEDLSGFNIIIDWGDGNTESLDEIPTLDLETTYTANWDSGKNKYIIDKDEITVSARVTSPKLSENSNLLSSIEDGFSFLEEKLSTVHSLKEIHPNVSEFNYKKENGSATGIFISHKYKEEGKYIVKIYGTDYFGIAHGTDWNLKQSIITNNIFTPPFNVGENKITLNGPSVSDQCPFSYTNVRLSRCFDQDLPISKNVTSLNSFAGIDNVCLFKINVPMYYNWVNAKDMAGIFKENKNLQYVVGAGVQNIFAESFTNIDIKGIFYKTNNLISTNVRLPNYSTNLIHNGKKQSWFDYYNWTDAQNSLQIDILDILPQDKVVDKLVRVGNLFKDFSKITCSDYNKLAQHLWGDNTVEWENIENAFSGSSLDLNRIPMSWGGIFDWDNKMYRLYNDLDEDTVTVYSLNEYLNDFKSIISCLYDGKFSNENISCLNDINPDIEDLSLVMTNINTMSNVLSSICLKKYIKVDNLDIENSSISDITRVINKFKKILF